MRWKAGTKTEDCKERFYVTHSHQIRVFLLCVFYVWLPCKVFEERVLVKKKSLLYCSWVNFDEAGHSVLQAVGLVPWVGPALTLSL